MFLYISEDYDERELHTEVFSTIEDFIYDYTGCKYSLQELEKLDYDTGFYTSENRCLILIKYGFWSGVGTEQELYSISSKVEMGLK